MLLLPFGIWESLNDIISNEKEMIMKIVDSIGNGFLAVCGELTFRRVVLGAGLALCGAGVISAAHGVCDLYTAADLASAVAQTCRPGAGGITSVIGGAGLALGGAGLAGLALD
jgi:hypothetical protein